MTERSRDERLGCIYSIAFRADFFMHHDLTVIVLDYHLDRMAESCCI